MGTRAHYIFEDDFFGTERKFPVYMHWDNYPSVALKRIKSAEQFAWKFPRYEADDFAAAFVRANKHEGGGLRLLSEIPRENEEFTYIVHADEIGLYVEIYHYDSHYDEGYLDHLLSRLD